MKKRNPVHHKKKRHSHRRTAAAPLWQVMVLLLCISVFTVSVFCFSRELLRYRAEDQANIELSQNVRQARSQAHGQTGSLAAEEIQSAYETLWEQNHDFIGWLFIEDTRIDYPVMQTPEDPEYYLHRAFDGSEAASGSLFADAAYSADGSSLLIYGHNMRDKSMFGSLNAYRSEEFAIQHPLIRFDTLTEERTYEVLAAFEWQALSEQETDTFYFYRYPDLSTPDLFYEYIRNVKAVSLYDTGVTASCGDKILTLSTCSSYGSNNRFVVVSVSH